MAWVAAIAVDSDASSGLQFSGLGDVATWATLVFTVVTALIAGGGFLLIWRRDRRQALADLHVSLTSGETAHARNVIGTLLYSSDTTANPGREESIESYFAMIWALQRARNVFRAHRITWRALNTPQSRLSKIMSAGSTDATLALTWNLVEIAENVGQFHEKYGEAWSVDDGDAWAEMDEYIHGQGLNDKRPAV